MPANAWVNFGLKDAQFRRGMARVEKKIAAVTKRTAKATAGLTGAVGGGLALGSIVGDSNRVRDMSRALGLTEERLQELEFAWGQANVTVEEGYQGLRTFTHRIAEARVGMGEAKDVAKELWLTWVDEEGQMKNLERSLEDYSNAILKIADPLERFRIRTKLWGEEAAKAARAVEGGSKAMEESAKRARAWFAVVDPQKLQDISEVGDLMNRIGATAKALAKRFVAIQVGSFQAAFGLQKYGQAAENAAEAQGKLKAAAEAADKKRVNEAAVKREAEIEKRRDVYGQLDKGRAELLAEAAREQLTLEEKLVDVRGRTHLVRKQLGTDDLDKLAEVVTEINALTEEELGIQRELDEVRGFDKAAELAQVHDIHRIRQEGSVAELRALEEKIKLSLQEQKLAAGDAERRVAAEKEQVEWTRELLDLRAQIVAERDDEIRDLQALEKGRGISLSELESAGATFAGVNTAALEMPLDKKAIELAKVQIDLLGKVVDNTGKNIEMKPAKTAGD